MIFLNSTWISFKDHVRLHQQAWLLMQGLDCSTRGRLLFSHFRQIFGHLRLFLDDFVSLWKFASVVVPDSCSLLGCSSGVFDEGRLATNENLKWQYPKREERALWTSSILLWAQLQNWFQMFIYSKISIQTISLPPFILNVILANTRQIWNPQNF